MQSPPLTGDQRFVKTINRMALLRLLRDEPGISRAGLAERSGLTKSTVSLLAKELIDELQALSPRPDQIMSSDDQKAFDRLPILADALEEAGCDDPAILAHLRGDGPHCRGCWVVDLALGK